MAEENGTMQKPTHSGIHRILNQKERVNPDRQLKPILQPSILPFGDGSTKAISDSIKSDRLWSDDARFKMCSYYSCIFTVPNMLRRHNNSAYKPMAFAIGPLHCSDKNLKHTNNIKFRYLSDLVSRVGVPLESLVESIMEIEPEARAHYGEKVTLNPEELVKLLVLDGCFIIEYLRKYAGPPIDDPVLSVSYMYQHVTHDLMLLENQIPWTVLDRLFTLTTTPMPMGDENRKQHSLPRLVLEFYQSALPINCPDFEVLACHPEKKKYRHILELLRQLLIKGASYQKKNKSNPASDQKKSPPGVVEGTQTEDETGASDPERSPGTPKIPTGKDWETLPPIPCATELENAGITLKAKTTPITAKDGLLISFDSGVLEVSPIRIEDTSEALFRNVIAFEQCVPGCRSEFTSYAILLDNLINTTEDLDRLQQAGIISYMLNPDDVLGFFNRLYNDTALNEFFYKKLCKDINVYCQRRWPRWRAALVGNYFSNPWVIASTLAACILLVLTFIPTGFTMTG